MDWIQFLEDNNIHYVSRGSNTKRGEISIQCPICGEDDQSQHLGISLTSENWGCLRNQEHRGHKPGYLVATLLGCSTAQARLIVDQYSKPDPSNLDEALSTLHSPEPTTPAQAMPSQFPEDFREIRSSGTTSKFWRYLAHRGFLLDVDQVIEDYNLKCCLTDRWKDRIILPLYQDQKLIGWTARAITKVVNAPRYLSSSDAIKQTVFNEDELQQGGRLLFVTEGPFDALKLDFYGKLLGARATCVFGVVMTIDQISIVSGLCRKFNRVVLLYDKEAVGAASSVIDWLPSRNVVMGQVPDQYKDPGELSADAVARLVEVYL